MDVDYNKHVLVQFYEADGDAKIFFNYGASWDIAAPPHGHLTRRALTEIMAALRYVPASRWEPADWGAERMGRRAQVFYWPVEVRL